MKLTNEKLSSNPNQRSAGWYSDRIGKLTGSSMANALDTLKNGSPSAKKIALIKRILAERMTDIVSNQYVSPSMQWGIENEEAARLTYQDRTGNLVMLVGFVDHPTIDALGASPDGLVGPSGLVEFKCPDTETHIEYLMAGVVPDKYKPQMLLQLACTRRTWCDFTSYDPRIKDVERKLFIRRFEPTKQEIIEIETKAAGFLAEIEVMFDNLFKE